MNKSPIEWCELTWNPLTGCLRKCSYCYAEDIAYRFAGRNGFPERPDHFDPTFHPARLEQPLKRRKPSTIFVCSMGELFGKWVPRDWIEAVLDVAFTADWHTFLFLTKSPCIAQEFHFPPNALLGTTIDEGDLAPSRLLCLALSDAPLKFASFEPLRSPVKGLDSLHVLDWIIIGAQTGKGAGEFAPKPEWIVEIINQADKHGIPVFMKDNLKPHWAGEWRREFPKVLED